MNQPDSGSEHVWHHRFDSTVDDRNVLLYCIVKHRLYKNYS